MDDALYILSTLFNTALTRDAIHLHRFKIHNIGADQYHIENVVNATPSFLLRIEAFRGAPEPAVGDLVDLSKQKMHDVQ